MVMVFRIIAIIFSTIAMILSFVGLNELKKDNVRRQKQYGEYPSCDQPNSATKDRKE